MIPTTKADRLIREHREILTRQQAKTLHGQIASGNEEAALLGIEKILRRYNDDDRNIIPLPERFNSESNDLRYSASDASDDTKSTEQLRIEELSRLVIVRNANDYEKDQV